MIRWTGSNGKSVFTIPKWWRYSAKWCLPVQLALDQGTRATATRSLSGNSDWVWVDALRLRACRASHPRRH